jgi:ubiquinone/menaquinone biosynthesis C-methylase UbiE
MTRVPPARPAAKVSIRRILDRGPLRAWADDTMDLPWGDPAFSERMLREHLDQRHDHASRRLGAIQTFVEALADWLDLQAGSSLLDLTCGPGLVARTFAERGVAVTGVDIAPAAIRHAREITSGLPCTFIGGDVRAVDLPRAGFDAAIYLYGQPAVLPPGDLQVVLERVRRVVRPGGAIALEVQQPSRVDRSTVTTWWTGADDLWGPGPHLVLSEQGWDPDARALVERHLVLTDQAEEPDVYGVSEQILEPHELADILGSAGFPDVRIHAAWDGLPFDGAAGWYVAVGR